MTATLSPGVYELASETLNPGRVDRRHKYDWRRWASWPVGFRLIVREEFLGSGDRMILVISPLKGTNHVHKRHPLWDVLVPHMVVVANPTLREVIAESSGHHVLKRLIEQKKITMDDIRGVL